MPDDPLPDELKVLLREIARRLDRPLATVYAQLGIDEAGHQTTARAKEKPRLRWGRDNAPDENCATFAWRAYQAEAKAGTLHMGIIRQDDRKNGTALAAKLVSWLRSKRYRKQVPEGFNIPTKPEWNTRQLADRLNDVDHYRTKPDTPDATNPAGGIKAKLAAAKDEALARGERGLARSIERHREDRERVPLPDGGYTNPDDALAAARLSNNFSNLQKRLKKAGIERLPRDDRVTEARRLSKAYFRGTDAQA